MKMHNLRNNLSAALCALSLSLGCTPAVQAAAPRMSWAQTLRKNLSEKLANPGKIFAYCQGHPRSALLPLAIMGLAVSAWYYAFDKYQEYRFNRRFEGEHDLPTYKEHKKLKADITNFYTAMQKPSWRPGDSHNTNSPIKNLYASYRTTFKYKNQTPMDDAQIETHLKWHILTQPKSCQDDHRSALLACIALYNHRFVNQRSVDSATIEKIYPNS